jgi:hypothetical protein
LVPSLIADVYGIVFINGEMNMKTVVIVVSFLVFMVTGAIATYKGLDVKRGSSWLYGAIGFLCGVVMIFSMSGNLIDSLKAGVIFAFLILFTGATMRHHKQRYTGMAKSLLLQYGKEDDPTLFAKLVRRLLGKYK